MYRLTKLTFGLILICSSFTFGQGLAQESSKSPQNPALLNAQSTFVDIPISDLSSINSEKMLLVPFTSGTNPMIASSTSGMSSTQTPQKIGYISLQTVESQWAEYLSFKSNLEKLFILDEKDFRNMKEEITEHAKILEDRRNQGLIGESEYENIKKGLSRRSQELVIYAKVRTQIVERKVNKRLDKATQKVIEVTKQIGKDEGYDIIFTEDVLWGKIPDLDISARVIKVLNATIHNI